MPWLEHEQGKRLWYEDQGNGRPLILIHGWSMSSAVWKFQLKELASLFRVIAPDLPGHGKSDAIHDGFTLAGACNTVISLCEALNLEQCILCGWSLGGFVALQSIASIRGRLAGLVLTGATPRFTVSDDWTSGLSARDVESLGILYRRSPQKARDHFIAGMFCNRERDPVGISGKLPDSMDEIPLPQISIALQGLNILLQADVRAMLPTIDIPTLVMYGSADSICIPEASRYLREKLCGMESIFEGCGHAPFLTQPAVWNSRLEQFTRRICEQSN